MVTYDIIKAYAKCCLARAAELDFQPGNTLEAEFQRTKARAAAEILEAAAAWESKNPLEFINKQKQIYADILGEDLYNE